MHEGYATRGRLFGGGDVKTHDRFAFSRIGYHEWLARSREEDAP